MSAADGVGGRIAGAAFALVGTPFRLHGRDPEYGLDCVGLVQRALAGAGIPAEAPTGYALRNTDIAASLELAPAAGLREISVPAAAGDIVLTRPGPGQFHLLIYGGNGLFVHAHAGLRRVVSMPGPLCAPVCKLWRCNPVTC